MRLVTMAAAVLPVLACTDSPFGADSWSEKHAGDYTLRWRVDGPALEVELEAPTAGYVAVGFDGGYLMQNADIILCCVTGKGAMARDDYGVAAESHQSDTVLGGTQDVSGVGGSESSGSTCVSFTIPMDSGDEWDKELTRGATCQVVLFTSAEGSDDFSSAPGGLVQTSIVI